MARYIAKNIVASKVAKNVKYNYHSIGIAEPMSVHVDTFGYGTIDDEKNC